MTDAPNAPQLPPIRYGVWLPRRGWLKNGHKGVFGDIHIEVAQSAAKLYGAGAFVTPIDDGFMSDIENTFLAQDIERHERRQWARRFTEWARGLTMKLSFKGVKS